MNLYAIPPLITAIFAFLIGSFVFLKNTKSRVNITFALLCLSAFVWLSGFTGMYLSGNEMVALRLARIGFVGIIFIPIFAYHFVVTFINQPPKKWVLPLLYTLTIPAAILGQTNYVYSGISRHFWGFYPNAGLLYFAFPISYVGLFLYATILLFFAFKKVGRAKEFIKVQQLKYVFIAIAGGIPGVMDYIIKYQIEFYPFGYLSAFFFIFVMAYAIVTTRLMDIEVIIKKGIVYSTLTALLTGLLLGIIFLGEHLFRGIIGYSSIWATLFAAVVIAFIFQPLRERIQGVVDKSFFRTRYDYQRILGRYSKALAILPTKLDRILRLTPYLVTKAMKLQGACSLVLERENHVYRVRTAEKEAKELLGKTLSQDSSLAQELLKSRKSLVRDELKHILSSTSLPSSMQRQIQKILSEMAELKASLCIPSISESEYFKKPTLITILGLGEKLSEEAFSDEDIRFLETLADQAAMAVEHAFVYEELRRSQDQLIQSEKLASLGTMAAGIAHELKNPLAFIQGTYQMLSKDWGDERFKETVKLLPQETQRMAKIINTLREYAKPKELKLEPVSVNEVMEKTLTIMGYLIKNVNLIKELNSQRKAQADSGKLMQVFSNIINNALQAMPSGGDLKILTRDQENQIRIDIADTGEGIPKGKLGKIFDPFFSTREAGSGLGLAIVQRIVEEHKGSIHVESEPGKGTTFTIYLPVEGE